MVVFAHDGRLSMGRPILGLGLLRKLYVQVLIAVVAGAITGYLYPHVAVGLKPFGDGFVKAIRVVVTPVIFTTVVVGLATMADIGRIARVGLKALIYFEAMSTLALVIGLIVGNVWPAGTSIHADPVTLDAHAVADYVTGAAHMTATDFLMNIIPNTFIDPFAKGDVLPVLFLAVLFGLALCHLGERARPLVNILELASQALFRMVRLIMVFAPLGAFGAMAFTVGRYGIQTILDLGELVGSVYLVSILFVIIGLGGMLRLAGFRLRQVLGHFKEEILFVFAATSAETMIPRSMEKLEALGCEKEVVGLVMPTGFSFNMDGTAIYMSMAVLFMAHATGTSLSLGQQIGMLVVMLFTSKGAAGVTGGGFIALAATMPALHVLPVAALTLLVGVDRFMAEIRAATNLTGNIVATLVVGRWVRAIDPAYAGKVMSGESSGSLAEPDGEIDAIGL
ncbi:MAG: aerobic C4-dicarboxylate transport protein [Acetobacteraceae bacterium]|jgi:aerobic C4-dicarboxylate transport protein|nr:aerobic C4-dicarboxylate transport protein [Acetobacteraceae bacterium]